MDTEHQMYKCFAEMMVDSFYGFLCKLHEQSSNRQIVDCNFMKKLHEIDDLLQKMLLKNDSTAAPASSSNILQSASSTNALVNKTEKISASGDKRKSFVDTSYSNRCHDSMFEKIQKLISKDIEGSDDSDCEMKSVPVHSDDLFKTDYPDECFSGKKSKKEISCEDLVSSTLGESKKCFDNDPFIKRLSLLESASREKPKEEVKVRDTSLVYYPFIVKVIEDVYMCQICGINNLPKNNVEPHVKGRPHEKALKLKGEVEIKGIPNLSKGIDERVPKKDTFTLVPFECELCKVQLNSMETLQQHRSGKQHARRLELEAARAAN